MHPSTVERWRHSHDFVVDHSRAEKSTHRVMWLTVIMMVAEIVAGYLFGSMALLADGWHMSTHVAAFAIALFAYRYARNHARNRLFTFGVGKVSVLGGFASAVTLAVVAFFMAFESLTRLLNPQPISFNEAIVVAVIGLVVNLVCGWMLHEQAEHDHGHDGATDDHHDHNLHAAYLHVLADALTSLLAIIALLAGKYQGWVWLDPLMGLVGAVVITRWAYGLMRDTSAILLDGMPDTAVEETIQRAIECDVDTRVADLHVWRIGPGALAVAVAVVTRTPQVPDYYKTLLQDIPSLAHILVEVNPCYDEVCAADIDQAH